MTPAGDLRYYRISFEEQFYYSFTRNLTMFLRGGIDATMPGIGPASLADLAPSDVIAPEGFFRTLGA